MLLEDGPYYLLQAALDFVGVFLKERYLNHLYLHLFHIVLLVLLFVNLMLLLQLLLERLL